MILSVISLMHGRNGNDIKMMQIRQCKQDWCSAMSLVLSVTVL